ncbi:MAG: hypothetical protein JWO00_200 [Candidatus Parcubacteria bacterium]|nr:hypothetical protein [Candidatus Parcubacteria bacterium]
MILFIVSFVAGVLTVLAPCVLPLLPVTLGSALGEAGNKRRPLIIIGSLSVSVFIFTLLLKGSTALIGASPSFWAYISAAILAVFGFSLLFPITWAKLMLKVPGHRKPDSWMAKGYQSRSHWWGDVLVGAALGPVFTTCSPTFFVILATVLPQSLAKGLIDLAAYVVGLALSLLLISWIGQKLVGKLEWAINPNGWFRKVLGILFVLVALAIATGYDKKVEADILASGFFDVTALEQSLHISLEGQKNIPQDPAGNGLGSNAATSTSGVTPASTTPGTKPVQSADTKSLIQKLISAVIPGERNQGKYVEMVKPSGYVNSEPFKLADYVGKKVILIDFIDYTCINCQRTFPYMKDWWAKYKDQGLEIVAFQTPEFSFEKDINNVKDAAKRFDLRFPIVLDNDYGTWNAYGNQYWPHKYLIDIHGNVVYDHIGEGNYAETEAEIVKQLNIRKQALGESGVVTASGSAVSDEAIQAASPETYFGAKRNERFGNGAPFTIGQKAFIAPTGDIAPNQFYLGGTWDIQKEYAETVTANATLSYTFTASKMYIVAQTADGSAATAHVLIDGKEIPDSWSGADVKKGLLMIDASRLYGLYANPAMGRHRIDIIFSKPGVRAYTFTFG